MAKTVSPRRSPLDQGASLTQSNFLAQLQIIFFVDHLTGKAMQMLPSLVKTAAQPT